MEVKRPRKTKDRSGEAPVMVIEGMEEIIEKDLGTHKIILERTIAEKLAYKNAISGEIKKRKYYKSLIGQGKFNDESLIQARVQMGINITQLSNKVKLSDDKIAFETNIVDTLTEQLEDQNNSLNHLYKYRKEQLDGSGN